MRSTQRPDTLVQDQKTPTSPISLATHRRSIHWGQGQLRHSSGHYENRWSEVHPEANLRGHYRSTTALCHLLAPAPHNTAESGQSVPMLLPKSANDWAKPARGAVTMWPCLLGVVLPGDVRRCSRGVGEVD